METNQRRIRLRSIVLSYALLLPLGVGRAYSDTAIDGEYVGLQSMPNLSPEDPDTKWFHENRLLIRHDEAILDMVPIWIKRGKKAYSASDGGFLTYRGRFFTKDGQSFIALRLFESDYVAVPKGKRDIYSEIKTYPVKFASEKIEFNGVRYRLTVLDKTTRERLLNLLSREAMEKGTGTTNPE